MIQNSILHRNTCTWILCTDKFQITETSGLLLFFSTFCLTNSKSHRIAIVLQRSVVLVVTSRTVSPNTKTVKQGGPNNNAWGSFFPKFSSIAVSESISPVT